MTKSKWRIETHTQINDAIKELGGEAFFKLVCSPNNSFMEVIKHNKKQMKKLYESER